MAGAPVRFYGNSAATATSVAVTITVSPATNNLLTVHGYVKNGGTSPVTPSGWTAGPSGTSGQDSAFSYWKVADGTETSVTLQATGPGDFSALYVEWSGLAASSPFEASIDNDAQLAAAATSIATGNVTPLTANGIAIAPFGTRDKTDFGTISANNGYTLYGTENSLGANKNILRLAYKVYTTTAAQNVTFSGTGIGDNCWAANLVFKEPAAAGLPAPYNVTLTKGTDGQRVDITADTDATETVASWHVFNGSDPATAPEVYSEVTATKTWVVDEANVGGGHGQVPPNNTYIDPVGFYIGYKVGTEYSPLVGPLWVEQTDTTAPNVASVTITGTQPSANVLRLEVDGAVESESALHPDEGYEVFVGGASQGFATPNDPLVLTDPWAINYTWTPGDGATVTARAKDVGNNQSGDSPSHLFVLPRFDSAPVVSVAVSSAYSYTIQTSVYLDSEAIALSAPTLPAWLGLVDNGDGTAVLSGTSPADSGSHLVVIRATEAGNSLVRDQSFHVNVGIAQGAGPTTLRAVTLNPVTLNPVSLTPV